MKTQSIWLIPLGFAIGSFATPFGKQLWSKLSNNFKVLIIRGGAIVIGLVGILLIMSAFR